MRLATAVAVAAGGALGSLLRWWVAGWVQQSRWLAASPHLAAFPTGTLAVNLSGCLAIGLLAGLFQARLLADPALRAFVLFGLLGGYTTFSAFGLETLRLLQEGSVGLALCNAVGSPLLGVAGAWLGDGLARAL